MTKTAQIVMRCAFEARPKFLTTSLVCCSYL